MEKMRLERESRGVYNSIQLHPDTREVEFTYGSPQRRRMSVGDFERFVATRLLGQTVATYNPQHGYQIEAYAPDGRIALWYPGNRSALLGRVTFRQSFEPWNMWGDKAGVLICFTYDQPGYNPATGRTSKDEGCTAAYAFLASIVGKRQGDPFGLLTGRAPAVYSKDRPPRWPDGQPLRAQKAPHV
jgi:hypothetical protein